jgi:hypothetical protein
MLYIDFLNGAMKKNNGVYVYIGYDKQGSRKKKEGKRVV